MVSKSSVVRKACKPTPGEPDNQVDRGEWMAKRYAAGLIQLRCPKCKLWHIWVRATGANMKLRKQQTGIAFPVHAPLG